MAWTNVEIAFILLLAGAVAAAPVRSWRLAGWMATVFVGAAAVLAWTTGLSVLLGGQTANGLVVGFPRFGAEAAVSLDALGAGFLLLITGVAFVSTIYSVGCMASYRRENPGRFYAFLQLFVAGMIGVVSVSDWLFFIIFWEMMTLASYFLVTFEQSDPAAARAGFKYFIMTHIATAGLLIAAIVLWHNTGSFAFEAHKSGLATMLPALRGLLLALYLIAFSTKAGIFPMGDWIPDAYPVAPAGASAIFAGVMSKLGAYGVLRVFLGMLPSAGTRAETMTWGLIIAALGTLSAFVGAVTAMKEKDAKRLLAFSSISQTGYIFLALGIGITFTGQPGLSSLALLGLLGAGFHILNDAIYKSLLFMNAGSIEYSTGTRDLNRVGGLASVMPVAAAAGLVGVLSLSGLPPTNGFVSKWVIYQAGVAGGLKFAPFVAVVVAAFFVSLCTLAYSLKFYSTAFLGKPTDAAKEPISLPRTMTFSQGLLAVVCLGIGLSPFWAIRLISSIFGAPLSSTFQVGTVGGLLATPSAAVVPAFWSPIAAGGALIVLFLVAEIIRGAGHAKVRTVPGWYCGEEHTDDEVRMRAQGIYSPFNVAFAKIYPTMPTLRLPSLKKLRSVLDLDSWLYDPLLATGGKAVDKVRRSHVGSPQLYMIWQVIGMVIVITVLFLLIR
jgi:hydrogenase-4 component B